MTAAPMNSASVDVPESVRLVMPRQYSVYCRGTSVRLLKETVNSGIRVRWNSQLLELIGKAGGVAIERVAIRGFRLNKRERMANSYLCTFRVHVQDLRSDLQGDVTSLIILNASSDDAAALEGVLAELRAAGVPISETA